MIRELKYKPDFGKTVDRFEAWWHQEIIDRPPIMCGCRRVREPRHVPPKTFASDKERWFDVEYHVDSATAGLEGLEFFGDSYPLFWPNMGPEIAAVPFGGDVQFGDWTTWSVPIVERPEQWQEIIDKPLNFDHPIWKAMEKMADYAIQVSAGRFVVGMTDLHGNYDILAALRDPQNLCMDLIDCPELLDKACEKAVACYLECFRRCWARSKAAGYGSVTWCPAYHEGPSYIPSCDFWCMTSLEMGKERIWPFVEKEIKALDRSHFHLDGPNALKFLDLLLECPELHSVQWVYGANNGPTAKWMDIYRRIHAAGKSMEIWCDSPKQALDMIEEFGPEGLWLSTGGFDDKASADAFLKEAEKLSAKHRRK